MEKRDLGGWKRLMDTSQTLIPEDEGWEGAKSMENCRDGVKGGGKSL